MGFLSSLRPPPLVDSHVTLNPYNALCSLTWLQQALFWSGLFAWFADSYDFFCVSLTIARLEALFHQNTHVMTTAITLTLLFRPVGAIIFGLLSDRFGRKWPLVVCLMIISALQIGTGFVNTFSAFLAVRSLFGIAMGGVWGLASAASMESIPVGARGVYSGIMHIGYPGGYLIASVVNLFLVPETPQTWRSIFWVGAGLSAAAAAIRSMLPESAVFERSQAAAERARMSSSEQTRIFFQQFQLMLKEHWLLWIFGIVMLSGLNFVSHGSQDLYTTFMQSSKGFSSSLSTTANIIGEAGAVAGALFGGYISQLIGRRVTLIAACVWACAFIPLWILPDAWGALSAGAFFFQFGLNTAWGTIVIYLNELAPPAFRGLYPGTVYQLGNAASAAAAQIEATAGLSIRKTVRGVDQPDYGKVQAIMAAASVGLVLVCAIFGPEKHSASFEVENTAIEDGVRLKAQELAFKDDPEDRISEKESGEARSSDLASVHKQT
ncbi:major facilitator superfamily domain-containing protein [Collybia nuda]|uniref:Major facilitator superfamily domain-containing protein n=1 Tax=Collybia nuda TaxID=64659 RepID=A0A9P5YF84_9AGAR|nr:major facilitator superfamily domain-containing protein [Collybia nuda]